MKKLGLALVLILTPITLAVPTQAEASTDNCDAAAMKQMTKDGTAEQYAPDGQGWRSLAYEVGYTPAVWSIMTLKCGRESGGQWDAFNPGGPAVGLLQNICPLWCSDLKITKAQMFDPRTNLAVGLHILCEQGWQAWNTKHSKRYGQVCLEIHWTAPPAPVVYDRGFEPRIEPRQTLSRLMLIW